VLPLVRELEAKAASANTGAREPEPAASVA